LEADPASSLAAACLPAAVIETSVSNIATRVNYGLDTPVSGGKVPAAWNVWRWEVKPERRDFLPKAVRDKTEARILERVQVPFSGYTAHRFRSLIIIM
jgi:chromatin assembly factor 1 subunit A